VGAVEAVPGELALTQKLWSRLPEIEDIGEPWDAAPQGDKVRRVAFLVAHGMGQQVPFETLSILGQALVTQDDERKKRERGSAAASETPRVNVRRVKLTDGEAAPELSRVEVEFRDKKLPPVDVHLYEAYWAPLTEGQISFLQTVAFLYTAAWNGIRPAFAQKAKLLGNWFRSESPDRVPQAPPAPKADGEDDNEKHFDRWMFGKFRDMPIKRGTYLLLLASVLLVSVVLIPAVLVFTPWGISLVQKMGAGLWVAVWRWPWWGRGLLGMGATVFLVLAWFVRYFLIEYVGDVAIYVSSYKVSRFDAIRNQIQLVVRTVAHEIYSAGVADRGQPRYDEVVIVGHSLGSVIAYDALNEAINWDEVECGFSRRVVARTRRLITFGSPLDKTAFLFRTQVSSARNLREALAARQQPLILNYDRYRPRETFKWINIWSKWDIVSGHLNYYDVSEDEGKSDPAFNPVCNHPDPEANTPLVAHVQYWQNKELHEVLYDAVWAGVGQPVSR
jgi:hypothetical protein